MRLGISTACFYPQPVEQTIDRIAALEFKLIEIFFNTESEYDPAFLKNLRHAAQRNEIEILSIHPYTSLMEGMLLFSNYERRTQDGFNQYHKYMHAAASLGAKYMTFHGERFMSQDTVFDHMERTYEIYHQLCRMAKEEGITLTQENVAWCKSREPEYLRLLAKHVPELRYTLDIKQANRAGQHWTAYLDIMKNRLRNIHVNDYDPAHSCLLPGEGSLNYEVFLNALQKYGYDRQMLIEVYSSNFSSDMQIQRAKQLLTDKFKQISH